MRIYLAMKQGKYRPGFYPSGRVPRELAAEWVEAGIACPASDDNVAQWSPEPQPTRVHQPAENVDTYDEETEEE